MTMIIKTMSGTDFEFTPKRLSLDEEESFWLCVEAIPEAKKRSEVFRHVREAMNFCLDHYDPKQLNLHDCMEIIAAAVKANEVSADDRKKSE
jgi:hypothetical protein